MGWVIREGSSASASNRDRSRAFWNVMMVLKPLGFTVDGVEALFERYPNGIAQKYEGRLRREIERTFNKIEIDDEPEEPKRRRPDKASTLDEVIATFDKWLVLRDKTPIYAALGTTAANLLPGDPVWLGIIGPPSSAKTELLNGLSRLFCAVRRSRWVASGRLSGSGINHAAANPRTTPGSLTSEKQREDQGEDEQEEKV